MLYFGNGLTGYYFYLHNQTFTHNRFRSYKGLDGVCACVILLVLLTFAEGCLTERVTLGKGCNFVRSKSLEGSFYVGSEGVISCSFEGVSP